MWDFVCVARSIDSCTIGLLSHCRLMNLAGRIRDTQQSKYLRDTKRAFGELSAPMLLPSASIRQGRAASAIPSAIVPSSPQGIDTSPGSPPPWLQAGAWTWEDLVIRLSLSLAGCFVLEAFENDGKCALAVAHCRCVRACARVCVCVTESER